MTTTTEATAIPAGMREVTEEEFFALLKADPRDIMPNHDFPEFTRWLVQSNRAVWGWSTPGWRNRSNAPRQWAVKA